MTAVTRSGYVAIIGRPNVGKSTLLNAIMGSKISIVSAKPQTTRFQILGVKTQNNTQTVYIDTPGIHDNEKQAMNRYMNKLAASIIPDADLILFMMDAGRWVKEDELVLSKLKTAKSPVFLLINKIDTLKDMKDLLPLIDQLKEKFLFTEIIPISALKADHLNILEQKIDEHLKEGPFLFPEEEITDKSLKFQVAEIIREKVILETTQEIPYATTVEIEDWKTEENRAEISALIWVERPGQKLIVIGKKGERLKKIGTEARIEIELLIKQKVFLRLWVKVKDHWTDDDKALRSLGYS